MIRATITQKQLTTLQSKKQWSQRERGYIRQNAFYSEHYMLLIVVSISNKWVGHRDTGYIELAEDNVC